jgi:hypothetical protein
VISQAKRPCRACPWKRTTNDADIPRFQVELARNLRSSCEQGFQPMFACHESEPGNEIVCAGYMASDDCMNNFYVRLALVQGRILMLVRDPGLFHTYEEMATAHGWFE